MSNSRTNYTGDDGENMSGTVKMNHNSHHAARGPCVQIPRLALAYIFLRLVDPRQDALNRK